jgi:mitochondrial fission protein ELM1
VRVISELDSLVARVVAAHGCNNMGTPRSVKKKAKENNEPTCMTRVHSSAKEGNSSACTTPNIHTNTIGIVILLSRRTPKEIIEKLSKWAAEKELRNHKHTQATEFRVQIFGHTDFPAGINPYKAVLDMSTCVMVTADSVSMCSEAVASSRPVHVGCVHKTAGKLALLHSLMQIACGTYTREYCADVGSVMVPARDTCDTAKVACMIMTLIEQRMGL